MTPSPRSCCIALYIAIVASSPPARAEGQVEFWAQRVVDTEVDKARADLAQPDWVDTGAILGKPDGRFAKLVIHNGWNDWGHITVDLGTEVGWGDLALVHRQVGPGNAKNITIHVAGADKRFIQLGQVKPSGSAVTSALPIDTPVRYVRVGGFAGGAVGIDSTWSFDAVGVRTGRAALSRLTPLLKRVDALDTRLKDLAGSASDEAKRTVETARVRLQEQRAHLDSLGTVPCDKVRETLTSIASELDRVDAAILRVGAMALLSRFNDDKLPAYVASWVPSMAKIRPADPLQAEQLNVAGRVSLARHEYEAIQIALVAGDADLRDVAVSVAPLRHASGGHVIPAEHVQVERLEHVLIGGTSWPDPILPLGSLTVPAGRQQSLWLRIYAPRGTPAGEYGTTVGIGAKDAHPVELTLTVRMRDFDLPVIAHTKHVISCGGGGICELMFRNRAGTGGGPCTGSIAEPRYLLRKDGSIGMDFVDYDKVMQTAFDLGLTVFGLPLSAGDGSGLIASRLHRTFFDEAAGKAVDVSMNPFDGEQARQRLTDWLRCFTKHLREKGWLERCFFYLWDEPNLAYTEKLVAVGRVVRQAVPDLKILVVMSPAEQWHEVTDIYCPHVPIFGHRNIDQRLADLRKLGKQIWWYNCGDPYPYPTYSIPHPSACARMSFLLMWKYGVTGNLYWTAGANANLDGNQGRNVGADGKGDGQLFYVSGGKRVPSQRLEMIRDGVEDYEYLWLLRDRIGRARARGIDVAEAEKLLTIPQDVARDVGHYTDDPEVIDRYRNQVAEAIEGLGRMLAK
ncbi:MAG: DUF4091 domain-containing protein [Phycisphaerae bacterium]|nr:DUF4091 domain-containing protein [Phycisphaerae bacterium]